MSRRAVLKHVVHVDDEVHVFDMTENAEILHVDSQLQNSVSFWFREDDDMLAEVVRRRFTIFPTGQSVPRGWEYVGTALDRRLVWHLFEAARP